MKIKLAIGMAWGNLKVVDSGVDWRTIAEDVDGITTKINDTWFDLLCTCGNTLRVWSREWPGTWYIKDCGCGVSEREGECAIISIAATLELKQRLAKYVAGKPIGRSQAARELIRTALRTGTRKREGKKTEGKYIIATLNMPLDLREQIAEYAAKYKVSKSQAVRELIDKGLEEKNA